MGNNSPVTTDAWSKLRGATQARIALGRAGGSLPTSEWLAFKAAHAAARDAVHNAFNADDLTKQIAAIGYQTAIVATLANDRFSFLQRPDKGRRLEEPSRQRLAELPRPESRPDVSIIVSDGLSALAVHRQAAPLLAELSPRFKSEGWRLAPVVIAPFARVAIQDEVGQLLDAKLALMLIGERPGLGSPDSMGAYLVHAPRVGNSDGHRNCVSNIRAEGLPVRAAADTIWYLLTEARRRQISGVQLKDLRALPGPESNRSLNLRR